MKNIIEITDLIKIVDSIKTKNPLIKESLERLSSAMSEGAVGNLELELFINLLVEEIDTVTMGDNL